MEEQRKQMGTHTNKQTKATPLLLHDLTLLVSHHQVYVTPFSSDSSELYFS